MRVLVVGDTCDAEAEGCAEFLTLRGFEVATVPGVIPWMLDAYAKHKPDLVLLIHLHGAAELANNILEKNPKQAIVLTTGHAATDCRIQEVRDLFAGVIEKPCDLRTFPDTLRAFASNTFREYTDRISELNNSLPEFSEACTPPEPALPQEAIDQTWKRYGFASPPSAEPKSAEVFEPYHFEVLARIERQERPKVLPQHKTVAADLKIADYNHKPEADYYRPLIAVAHDPAVGPKQRFRGLTVVEMFEVERRAGVQPVNWSPAISLALDLAALAGWFLSAIR